jgi:hypothetical protein
MQRAVVELQRVEAVTNGMPASEGRTTMVSASVMVPSTTFSRVA